MKQRTLKRSYLFDGKGIHTGKQVTMEVSPAPVNTGVRFIRTDIGPDAAVDAVAENVSRTSRSTTISAGKVSVRTIEHLLSALTGLGIDNAIIRLNSSEVPILDGSAKPYVDAIVPDGVVEQDAERKWVELAGPLEIAVSKHGSYIRIEPSDEPSVDITVDFDSKVLGVQNIHWDMQTDYASQIAPCRTFCFLHEIKRLLFFGLAKGGDVKNAIIVVEKPVSKCEMKFISRLFKQPVGEFRQPGYFNNLSLRFPDECGRHKMLDILGDLRLCGGFLKAKVTAYKPGHRINTTAALTVSDKAIR